MNICYIELYNSVYHGETNIDILNRYISIFEPLTLNEFYNLNKEEFIIYYNNRIFKIELILNYNLNDQILSYNKTNILVRFQLFWKKYYNEKKKFYKNPRNLLYRELYGKFPIIKFDINVYN